MIIWNVVNAVLFVGAAMSHIAKFGKMDYVEGSKLIVKFDDAAIGASILAAIAVALSYTRGLLAYQHNLLHTAFALLFLGLGFRYQVSRIFQQREDDKVAEAMAKHLDALSGSIRSFTDNLLKLSDEKPRE